MEKLNSSSELTEVSLSCIRLHTIGSSDCASATISAPLSRQLESQSYTAG